MLKCFAMIGAIWLLSSLFEAKAQAEEKEPSAVVEIGGAGEWGLRDGCLSFGPSAAVEYAPINRLEIEVGIAPCLVAVSTEWGTTFHSKTRSRCQIPLSS